MSRILPRHFVEKPWGRTDLPTVFGAGDRKIGEVWYDTPDSPLPVLVKWLFTSERLSIQVHPSDVEAQARGLPSGKEECWIVTHAEPGATLGIGTRQALTDTELREASQSGEIEELVDWKPVKAGDWFYIPAGTVHAIGAGVTLVEVQQNADVTYRLYDYGRPRELHLDDGVAVSRAAPYGGPRGSLTSVGNDLPFVCGPSFTISHLSEGNDFDSSASGSCLLVPLKGEVTCDDVSGPPGSVLMFHPGATIVVQPGSECLRVAISS